MLATAFLAVLLMITGIGRAAVSDLRVNGRFSDGTLSGRDGRSNLRKLLHHQIQSNILRSVDLDSFDIQVSPTSSKVSLPTIIRLYTPTLQPPPHRHINMPMRFGRDSVHGDDHGSSSNGNMPQRFGRSGTALQPCEHCREARRGPRRHVRYARSGRSLVGTLLDAQLLRTGAKILMSHQL